jgi:hypothetical protein
MDWEIPSTKKGFSDFMERNYPRQDLAEVPGQMKGGWRLGNKTLHFFASSYFSNLH